LMYNRMDRKITSPHTSPAILTHVNFFLKDGNLDIERDG